MTADGNILRISLTLGVNELFRWPEIQAALAIFQFLDGHLNRDTLKGFWREVSEDKLKDTKIENAIDILAKLSV